MKPPMHKTVPTRSFWQPQDSMRLLWPLRPAKRFKISRSSTTEAAHWPLLPIHNRCLCTTPRLAIRRTKVQLAAAEATKDNARPADHRILGIEQSLFTTHESSPGSPLFQPNGAHIFQKLQSFLRAQYPSYGIREVITPTIYKIGLWTQSGHWENYKDEMFAVIGRPKGSAVKEGNGSGSRGPQTLWDIPQDSRKPKMDWHMEDLKELSPPGSYGLKPMNCPGHCLLFKSEKRSYRDLPIRYADFSPLHRNEVSGALSGLTRVRRFHQDDGHIFCRPSQVRKEIANTLSFVKMVYSTFGLGPYKLVLSTRPSGGKYIGELDEWDRAEGHLRGALTDSGEIWELNMGDGAFYGPKIDIILKDSDGKEHQTATIQLDFQLPQRFELEYQAPAPEQEKLGLTTTDPRLLEEVGIVRPVMIHRAILGSLERFMALLIEHHKGRWPFWLSPRQAIILTVGEKPEVTDFAASIADKLRTPDGPALPQKMQAPHFIIDTDFRAESLPKKVLDAKKKKYNIICVIGDRNVKEQTIDIDLSGQPNQLATWAIVEKAKLGSQAPYQGGQSNGQRSLPSVKLGEQQLISVMLGLNDKYL